MSASSSEWSESSSGLSEERRVALNITEDSVTLLSNRKMNSTSNYRVYRINLTITLNEEENALRNIILMSLSGLFTIIVLLCICRRSMR